MTIEDKDGNKYSGYWWHTASKAADCDIDGNGRMARLVMNMLQFEFGLIPAKILKDDKEEYIKSLIATREEENLEIFSDFMTSMMEKNLTDEIETYIKSVGES